MTDEELLELQRKAQAYDHSLVTATYYYGNCALDAERKKIEKMFPQMKDEYAKIMLTEIRNHIIKEVGEYPGENRKEHRWLRWLEAEIRKRKDNIGRIDGVKVNGEPIRTEPKRTILEQIVDQKFLDNTFREEFVLSLRNCLKCDSELTEEQADIFADAYGDELFNLRSGYITTGLAEDDLAAWRKTREELKKKRESETK